MLSQQTLAYQLELTHELREQRSCLTEVLGFPEGLELDTELAHFPYAQVAAGAIQVVSHSCQRFSITLLERAL